MLEELGNTATLSWNTKGTLLGIPTWGIQPRQFGILRGELLEEWGIQPRQVGILRGHLEELGNTATSSWNTKGTLLEELGNTATSSWNTKWDTAGGTYSHVKSEY